MANIQKKQYSIDDFKAGYDDVTALYDLSDDLLATVEAGGISSPEDQLKLVEPLINEVAEAADVLAEEFILVAESKKPYSASKFSKKRIENALRRIFVAIHEYGENTKQTASNIATPIVKKIQAQLDKIVVIFFEFVQISLQSVMNKSEMEAIRLRDTRIAIMMHQIGLASQH